MSGASPGAAHPHLRLVLPHQLLEEHLRVEPGTQLVLVEHDLLLRRYSFHSHKLVLHRASMTRFAHRLRDAGRTVHVLASDARLSSHDQLAALVRDLAPARVTWFDPVDDWLERDLASALAVGGYQPRDEDVLESPSFLTDRGQVDAWFSGEGARMHDFYVWQRRRLGILLDDFGPYEDAISAEHPFLAHSLLTSSLNIGLLTPGEVVRAVLDGARADTPLASVEGFVRQVIG